MLSWINDQMVQEVAAGGPGGRLCYDALALQAERAHPAQIRRDRVQDALRARQRSRPAHARLIEDYVEQNIFRNITLEELANICNCTPVQFARKFRVHYGMRPHAYVLRRKVEHACQHLRRDRVALKEIALLARLRRPEPPQSRVPAAHERDAGGVPPAGLRDQARGVRSQALAIDRARYCLHRRRIDPGKALLDPVRDSRDRPAITALALSRRAIWSARQRPADRTEIVAQLRLVARADDHG